MSKFFTLGVKLFTLGLENPGVGLVAGWEGERAAFSGRGYSTFLYVATAQALNTAAKERRARTWRLRSASVQPLRKMARMASTK